LSNITDYGFPLSTEPIQNEQNTAECINLSESVAHNGAVVLTPTSFDDGTEQVNKGSPLLAIEAAASTSSGSTGPNHNSEKELANESFPAPNTKKKRRKKTPTIALGLSTNRNSSKRRIKKTKTTSSSSTPGGFSHYVPSIAVEGLLLPPFHHPVNHREAIKPEAEQAPPEASSKENLMLTISNQFHHRAESPRPGCSFITEEPAKDLMIAAPMMLGNQLNLAPQMLGNQLNPASSVAQEMSGLLSAELDMHNASNALTSSTITTSSSSFMGDVSPMVNSTMVTLSSAPSPHHLADLLERQWEQGHQLFMEEGQRYDSKKLCDFMYIFFKYVIQFILYLVASLLSCLHTIRQDNTQLENNVASLTQRRDHLLTDNARYFAPLTVQTATEAPLMTNSGSSPDETSNSTAGSF